MKFRYQTARLLSYKVGWLMKGNRSADMDAAMAKLYVSEAFVKSCLDAVQIHGGSGFMTELEFERELRDSVGSTLYSGTSEIQRNIIPPGAAPVISTLTKKPKGERRWYSVNKPMIH